MKTIVMILCLLSSLTTFSQKDTTYYFGVNGKLGLEENYQFKKIIRAKSKNKTVVVTYSFLEKGWVKCLTENYSKIDANTYLIRLKSNNAKNTLTCNFKPENGVFKFIELVDGKIKRTGYTKSKIPLILQGNVTDYYSNGNVKSESVYNNNELVSNKNWLEDGTEYFDNIFYSVDEIPGFTLGVKYLQDHILNNLKKYKIDYTRVSGRIVVGFVVLEDGKLGGFRILDGIHDNLNEIALNSFKTLMGDWTPARLNGQPVRYFQTFPINFIYNEKEMEYFDFASGQITWKSN